MEATESQIQEGSSKFIVNDENDATQSNQIIEETRGIAQESMDEEQFFSQDEEVMDETQQRISKFLPISVEENLKMQFSQQEDSEQQSIQTEVVFKGQLPFQEEDKSLNQPIGNEISQAYQLIGVKSKFAPKQKDIRAAKQLSASTNQNKKLQRDRAFTEDHQHPDMMIYENRKGNQIVSIGSTDMPNNMKLQNSSKYGEGSKRGVGEATLQTQKNVIYHDSAIKENANSLSNKIINNLKSLTSQEKLTHQEVIPVVHQQFDSNEQEDIQDTPLVVMGNNDDNLGTSYSFQGKSDDNNIFDQDYIFENGLSQSKADLHNKSDDKEQQSLSEKDDEKLLISDLKSNSTNQYDDQEDQYQEEEESPMLNNPSQVQQEQRIHIVEDDDVEPVFIANDDGDDDSEEADYEGNGGKESLEDFDEGLQQDLDQIQINSQLEQQQQQQQQWQQSKRPLNGGKNSSKLLQPQQPSNWLHSHPSDEEIQSKAALIQQQLQVQKRNRHHLRQHSFNSGGQKRYTNTSSAPLASNNQQFYQKQNYQRTQRESRTALQQQLLSSSNVQQNQDQAKSFAPKDFSMKQGVMAGRYSQSYRQMRSSAGMIRQNNNNSNVVNNSNQQWIVQTEMSNVVNNFKMARVQTAVGPKPERLQSAMFIKSYQDRQQLAFQKFVNRGGQSGLYRNRSNSTAVPFFQQNYTVDQRRQENQTTYQQSGKSSTHRFQSVEGGGTTPITINYLKSQRNIGNISRPFTSKTTTVRGKSTTQIQQQQNNWRDKKSRHILQSAGIRRNEDSRVASQKLIKVPQSRYGAKQIICGRAISHSMLTSQQNLRTSATTFNHTRANSSEVAMSKEASVKQLRMGSYLNKNPNQHHLHQMVSSNFSQKDIMLQNNTNQATALAISQSPERNFQIEEQQNSARQIAREMTAVPQMKQLQHQQQLQGQQQYPVMNFKTSKTDNGSKLLDNIIKTEEELAEGFSMYNRGKNLKRSLINPNRVKEYLRKLKEEREFLNYAEDQKNHYLSMKDVEVSLEDQSQDSSLNNLKIVTVPKMPEPQAVRGDPGLTFLSDNYLNQKKQWKLMIDFFQKNPSALMDAIPTPPKLDQEDQAVQSPLQPSKLAAALAVEQQNFLQEDGQSNHSDGNNQQNDDHSTSNIVNNDNGQSSNQPQIHTFQGNNNGGTKKSRTMRDLPKRRNTDDSHKKVFTSTNQTSFVSDAPYGQKRNGRQKSIGVRHMTSSSSNANSNSTNQRRRFASNKRLQKKIEETSQTRRGSILSKKPVQIVCEYIDWKDSYFYRQLIVRHTDDQNKWENQDLITDDDHEMLSRLIRNFKVKKSSKQGEELLKMCPSMIRKCYNSIKMMLKEILSDSYWRIEYDQMNLNDPYVCTRAPKGFLTSQVKIFTLDSLLHRVLALKNLRKEIRQFLELVHQRELVLKQMQLAVESIKTDAFFMTEEDLEQRKQYYEEDEKSKLMLEISAQQNPRIEMLGMGNNLVELTDQIIKHSIKFFKAINRQFTYVKLEQFIFQEADYIDVAVKEVDEVAKIFSHYEIEINKLQNSNLQISPLDKYNMASAIRIQNKQQNNSLSKLAKTSQFTKMGRKENFINQRKTSISTLDIQPIIEDQESSIDAI